MKEILRRKNFLSGILGEYIDLGIDTGLFDTDNIDSVLSRIQFTEIKEDNSIPGYYESGFKNGRFVITINRELCLQNCGERYIDRIIFNQLTHFANEIFRDLSVYKSHQILGFKDRYSILVKGNDSVSNPECGMMMLDKELCAYVAQLMVSKKYNTEPLIKKDREISFDRLKSIMRRPTTDYPDSTTFSEIFAKTIYKNDSMFRLSKDALSDRFLDNMFCKYGLRDDGMKTLYELLGYMGNIMISSTMIELGLDKINSDDNRKLVLRSMNEVINKTEKIVKEN